MQALVVSYARMKRFSVKFVSQLGLRATHQALCGAVLGSAVAVLGSAVAVLGVPCLLASLPPLCHLML